MQIYGTDSVWAALRAGGVQALIDGNVAEAVSPTSPALSEAETPPDTVGTPSNKEALCPLQLGC